MPNKKSLKEETFVDKITTFGRRRKLKEAEEAENLVKDGVTAIDLPDQPLISDIPPSDYLLEENEERCMIEPKSREDIKLKQLISLIMEWINDELVQDRILVKDLEEDLYDGQVLGKLIEKLANIKLDIAEVTQTEEGRRQKLKTVLGAINHILDLPYNETMWTVEAIRSKDLVSMIRLSLALARHFGPPTLLRALPEALCVTLVVVRKEGGLLKTRRIVTDLMRGASPNSGAQDDLDYANMGASRQYTTAASTYENVNASPGRRDAFDTLFDHAPEKLGIVQKSLLAFARKHLSQLEIDVDDLSEQFSDGVNLILLMSQLEGYFVPLHAYHFDPINEEEKLHNLTLAIELIQEAGIPNPKSSPEELANKDLKSTLRLLYALFTKYKNI